MARENDCRNCGKTRWAGNKHVASCPSGKGGKLVVVEDTNGYAWVRNRPADYDRLSAREQWAIDERLGILDWEP